MLKTPTLVLILILAFIALLRVPSLFEPNWYGDEGIFAAVAHGLNLGGALYIDAWDNKPPFVYLLYAVIFKIFGPEQFWIRIVAGISVLVTTFLIFKIARKTIGETRALVASLIFGVSASSPVLEANLALTELFMILPQTLAFFLFINLADEKKSSRFQTYLFLTMGALFSIAFLFKQVGALEGAALGLFVLITQKEPIRKGLLLIFGFFIPFIFVSLYFLAAGGTYQFKEFFFASYTYYVIYFGESPSYGIWFTILKFIPLISASLWLILQKIRGQKISPVLLFVLWFTASFLGSLFSGRPYGHYLVSILPAGSLLVASVKIPKKFDKSLALALIFIILPVSILLFNAFKTFVGTFDPLRLSYYKNFILFSFGKMNLSSYNNSFDLNVEEIMALKAFLNSQNAEGEVVYIWGDYPWLYPLSGVKNPTRYVTSFHVFGVPQGKEEVVEKVEETKPKFVLKTKNAIGEFEGLEIILAAGYEKKWIIKETEIYSKLEKKNGPFVF